MLISIDRYNSFVEKFLVFVSSVESVERYYRHFNWLPEYPGLHYQTGVEAESIEIFNGPVELKNSCNKYTDNISRLSRNILLHYLELYRDILSGIPDPIVLTWQFYCALTEYEKLCMQIFFERTMDPLAGLRTIPVNDLLDREEINVLNGLKAGSHPPVDLNGIKRKRLPGTDYTGYACFIVKVTRLCNLRCTYCQDWREGPGNTLTTTDSIRIFSNIFRSHRLKVIEFVWHGGEPTLIGLKKLYKLLYTINHLKIPGQQIKQTIQSNGVSLTDEWVQMLKAFGFSMGISIDGPDYIHDANRPDIKQRPTFFKVSRTIRRLKAHDVPVNVIIVGNKTLMRLGAVSLLDFLAGQQIANCCILPLLPGNCHADPGFDYSEYRKQYFDFLFDLFIERQKMELQVGIREIDTLLDIIGSRNPLHCELLGNCIGTFFSIDPNGDVFHCDKYVKDQKFRLGNLLYETIDEISAKRHTVNLHSENERAVNSYSVCPHFKKCRGWCPHEFYLKTLYGMDKSTCCGLDYIINKIMSATLIGNSYATTT